MATGKKKIRFDQEPNCFNDTKERYQYKRSSVGLVNSYSLRRASCGVSFDLDDFASLQAESEVARQAILRQYPRELQPSSVGQYSDMAYAVALTRHVRW